MKKPSRRKSAGRGGKIPMTYYRSSNQPADTSPFKKKRPGSSRFKKVRIFIFNIALVVSLLLVLLYSLIVKSSPNVAVSSQIYHPQGVYRAIAANELRSLKNHNKISFDEQSVTSALHSKFPEIERATLELPIFSQVPTINLKISPPSLLLKDDNDSYVVDGQGVAVAKASELPQIKNLPVLVDESGFSAKAGKPVLSAAGVNFIKTLLAQSAKANVPIKSVSLPPLAEEINLRTNDQGYYVKFFIGGDVLKQIGQFLAARQQFQSAGNQPAEYLDVRIAGKIFYK